MRSWGGHVLILEDAPGLVLTLLSGCSVCRPPVGAPVTKQPGKDKGRPNRTTALQTGLRPRQGVRASAATLKGNLVGRGSCAPREAYIVRGPHSRPALQGRDTGSRHAIGQTTPCCSVMTFNRGRFSSRLRPVPRPSTSLPKCPSQSVQPRGPNSSDIKPLHSFQTRHVVRECQ